MQERRNGRPRRKRRCRRVHGHAVAPRVYWGPPSLDTRWKHPQPKQLRPRVADPAPTPGDSAWVRSAHDCPPVPAVGERRANPSPPRRPVHARAAAELHGCQHQQPPCRARALKKAMPVACPLCPRGAGRSPYPGCAGVSAKPPGSCPRSRRRHRRSAQPGPAAASSPGAPPLPQPPPLQLQARPLARPSRRLCPGCPQTWRP